jgi:Cu(I)/Ag(I) efflux system membrane fusion protein
VQVYEDEAPLITPGSRLTIEVPSLPGRTLEATVFGVDPTVNPTTRTVRVRALVATPDRELRPDAYATATIRVPLGDRLAVPRNAVLDSGIHRLVFVIDGDGTFTPHEVHLGRAAQGYFEVLDGVKAGDEVATSANFLIDSESRFRSAIAAFGPTDEPAHVH